jgi:hypothetical protein
MDDQRTEGRGEGSVKVKCPRVQRSLIQSSSAESRADDSERVIAALRQEVDALKKAAQENQMRNLTTLNNTKTNRGIPRRTNPICLDCKPLSLIRLIQKIITILV